MLASVALRTSIGSRRRSGRPAPAGRRRRGTPGARSAGGGAVEGGQPLLVATHHLAVDQAGPHLEMVHGLDHQRKAVGPVIAPPGDQPDANGIATRHEPVAVVLDLVNPVGAGRGLVGGGWQARLYEGGSTQHSAYLGGPQKKLKSILQGTKYRATYWGDASAEPCCPTRCRDKPRSAPPLAGFSFVWSHACRDLGKPVEASEKKAPAVRLSRGP